MTEQPTGHPTDGPAEPAPGRVTLRAGASSRVRRPGMTLTALQVPTVTTRQRVVDRVHTRTSELALPHLEGKAVLPPGSSGGAPKPGPGGTWTYVQSFPLLTWRFLHPLGRPPMVEVFIGLGAERVLADSDVTSTALEVVVEWAEPTVGSVVLR